MSNQIPIIEGSLLVSMACNLGASKAIAFAEFANESKELTEAQQKLLMRGWLAAEHLPGDASLESSDLHKCLFALRQAWIMLAFYERNNQ